MSKRPTWAAEPPPEPRVMAVSFTAFADPEGTFTREVVVPRHLRVFLASPGDVHDERNQARAVLEGLPYDTFLRGQVTLEVVAWDKPGAGTPMLATMTPQEAIETGLPKPSECDIVIVIFWSRMGTPLPEDWVKPAAYRYLADTEWHDLDARYLSGAEWEYVDTLQAAQG
ncbi:MAG: hypothetical protein V3R80_08420, partial [Candidatus Tectomicrobia bacterium]